MRRWYGEPNPGADTMRRLRQFWQQTDNNTPDAGTARLRQGVFSCPRAGTAQGAHAASSAQGDAGERRAERYVPELPWYQMPHPSGPKVPPAPLQTPACPAGTTPPPSHTGCTPRRRRRRQTWPPVPGEIRRRTRSHPLEARPDRAFEWECSTPSASSPAAASTPAR